MDNLLLLFLGLALVLLGLGLYLVSSRRRHALQEEENDLTIMNQGLSIEQEVELPLEEDSSMQRQEIISESHDMAQSEPVASESVAEISMQPNEQLESDLLTEYEIYLQFGYLDKAAKTLNDYLELQENPSSKLQSKLLNLYLECKQVDNFSSLLETLYQQKKIGQDVLQMGILSGLKIDVNNLNLRLLAQSELDWGPEEILGKLDPAAAQSKKESFSEKNTQSRKNNIRTETSAEEEPRCNSDGRLMLLNGFAKLNLKLDVEERSAIKGFLEPKAIAKFFMIDGDYNGALRTFENALSKSDRPMTLLIDVLHLDCLMQNIESFIRHYYQLIIKMGNQGALLKNQLLKMGVKLEKHPFFADVELVMDNKIEVERIAKQYAFIADPAAYDKIRTVKRKPLVVSRLDIETTPEHADQIIHYDVKQHSALMEAEARLEYGQIEEAIATLEGALYENPNEASALYLYLLDLYARLEDKDRFMEFWRRIKETGVSLSEEVRLAMDHTERRLH